MLRSCAPERDCAPFLGAGKITREWPAERPRPDSQSKEVSAAPCPSLPPRDRTRPVEATFRALDPDQREAWKREETDFIKEHDRDDADVWFLVDVRWLEAWRAFIKEGDNDFPGPIDNGRLMDSASGQPRPGFLVREHYRGVNSALWHFWHNRYGGGPAIQRDKLDLYALPQEELDKTVTVPRPGGSRSATAGLEETLVVQRPARPGDSRTPPLRPGGSRTPPTAGPEDTVVVQRPGRPGGSRTPPLRPGGSRTPPTEGLEDTVVFQRPGRSPPSRDEAEATRKPPREEQALAGSPWRSSSVRPRRLQPLREEPRSNERRGSASSPRSGASQRSRAGGQQSVAFAAPAPPPTRAGGSAANRGTSVPVAGGRQSRNSKAALKCDKCDGPHETDSCPHFSKLRERHKDAWTMLGKAGKAGQSKEDVPVVSSGRVVSQPGDGSCLFHSLSYGLSGRSQGQSLRREICDFIAKNPDLEIGDNALKDWITYDSGGNVQSYARQMAGSSWGGGIEMAAFAKLKGVNVHVYEKASGGFRRISAFESPGAKKTISVLYGGRAHYDALVL